MGVYIKGIEMPKNCDGCRIMALEDTNCEAELYCGCPIVFKAHPQGVDHRPDYCPLIPVPEHGRLIDANALYKEAFKRSETKDGYYNCLEPVISCYTIDNAPTIIPADPAEEGE